MAGHRLGLAILVLEGRGFGWRGGLAGLGGSGGGSVFAVHVNAVADGEDATEMAPRMTK